MRLCIVCRGVVRLVRVVEAGSGFVEVEGRYSVAKTLQPS